MHLQIYVKVLHHEAKWRCIIDANEEANKVFSIPFFLKAYSKHIKVLHRSANKHN